MNFKSELPESILTGGFFLLLACLPVAAVVYAGYASKPKERPVTLEDQYPDEHLGV